MIGLFPHSLLKTFACCALVLAAGCEASIGGGQAVDAGSSRIDASLISECGRAASPAVIWSIEGGGMAGASVLGVVDAGVVLDPVSQSGDWLEIEHETLAGWVSAQLFEPAECSDTGIEPEEPAGTRHVLVVIFDPIDPASGQPLHQVFNWSDPHDLVEQGVAWWEEASKGKLIYRVDEIVDIDGFPQKVDGFTYNFTSWRDVWEGRAQSHNPDLSDYDIIAAQTNLCERVNAGELDELWLFGAPHMGFGESGLIGPGPFAYNGPAFEGNGCNKLVPVMGFNYERRLPEMLHNWGHRTEATMSQVFGGWMENRMAHDWDRFGLVAVQSPDYGFSGCGSMHYPPNAPNEYNFNSTNVEQTFCADFLDYPELAADPSSQLVDIDCTAWGCTDLGYTQWWLNHLPRAEGMSSGGVWHDWWNYVADPNQARSCGSFTTESDCDALAHCNWHCGGCYVLAVEESDACSACGTQVELPDCNAAGCAWYSCPSGQVQCWPGGTDPTIACGG